MARLSCRPSSSCRVPRVPILKSRRRCRRFMRELVRRTLARRCRPSVQGRSERPPRSVSGAKPRRRGDARPCVHPRSRSASRRARSGSGSSAARACTRERPRRRPRPRAARRSPRRPSRAPQATPPGAGDALVVHDAGVPAASRPPRRPRLRRTRARSRRASSSCDGQIAPRERSPGDRAAPAPARARGASRRRSGRSSSTPGGRGPPGRRRRRERCARAGRPPRARPVRDPPA